MRMLLTRSKNLLRQMCRRKMFLAMGRLAVQETRRDISFQPKDFKGRLDDIKERLATRFIKSVIANKPRHIVIDGITYHSDTVLDEILAGWDKTEELVKEQGKCLAKGDKIISNGLSLMNLLDKRLSRVTTSRNRWRMFGLGMSIGFIGCVIVRSIYSFIH